MTSDEQQELGQIQSVLIPTDVVPLLVPSTSVAEVTAVTVLTPVASAAQCVLGVFDWRGIRLPVGSLEALAGRPKPAPGQRSKIVVFYPLAGENSLDFFGILSSADPQSRRVTGDQIQAERVDGVDAPFLVQTCRLGDMVVAIPDLKAIHEAIGLGFGESTQGNKKKRKS